jgi:hypothetical protein
VSTVELVAVLEKVVEETGVDEAEGELEVVGNVMTLPPGASMLTSTTTGTTMAKAMMTTRSMVDRAVRNSTGTEYLINLSG